VRYGGNTPCIEVRTSAGWLIVLDAGTGIRELGRSLIERAKGAPIRGDIFLTHVHWDHIQGIPFFGPLFQRGNHFTIWGSKSLEPNLDRVVRSQMSSVVFPVAFEQLDATVEFCELGEGRRTANGYEVSALEVRHPGGALGYRFAEGSNGAPALVYISDNELGVGATYDTRSDWRRKLVEFVRGARVLVHDSTYTAAEYAQHHGWGHSTYGEAVDLALDAGVETLVLFHHKPERTDDEVDTILADCRAAVERRGGRLRIVAAAEGMTLTV
jgi:ribonuclease BN (tRNA processing enzyme)